MLPTASPPSQPGCATHEPFFDPGRIGLSAGKTPIGQALAREAARATAAALRTDSLRYAFLVWVLTVCAEMPR